MSEEDIRNIEMEFAGEVEYCSKTWRWIHRGLNIDKAIRKVKTDIQIMENIV